MSDEQAQKWLNADGTITLDDLIEASCAAIGEKDVGLRLAFAPNQTDRKGRKILSKAIVAKVQMTPDQARDLARALLIYADRPRPPLPTPPKMH